MTLLETIAELSFEYPSAPIADGQTVIIASGGMTHDADTPPLLCSRRDLAVTTWAAAVRECIPTGSPVRWVEEPGMYRFQVTVSNADTMTHRVVEDRFAVVASVVWA